MRDVIERIKAFDLAIQALDFIDSLSKMKPKRVGHLHSTPHKDGTYTWTVSWTERVNKK